MKASTEAKFALGDLCVAHSRSLNMAEPLVGFSYGALDGFAGLFDEHDVVLHGLQARGEVAFALLQLRGGGVILEGLGGLAQLRVLRLQFFTKPELCSYMRARASKKVWYEGASRLRTNSSLAVTGTRTLALVCINIALLIVQFFLETIKLGLGFL